MKQNISVEDLMELTEEQKEKLREMWEHNYGDIFYFSDRDNWYSSSGEYICFGHKDEFVSTGNDKGFHKKYCTPLLNIGQMIEILNYKGEFFRLDNMYAPLNKSNGWGVTIPRLKKEFRAEELVDCLWCAVKNIL